MQRFYRLPPWCAGYLEETKTLISHTNHLQVIPYDMQGPAKGVAAAGEGARARRRRRRRVLHVLALPLHRAARAGAIQHLLQPVLGGESDE